MITFTVNQNVFKMVKRGSIYIITNSSHTTLYTGVTSELLYRIQDHKNKKYPNSFSAKYNLNKLVYYESFHSIEEAIVREKQIKTGSRSKKLKLINEFNPHWNDLYDEILKW